MIEYVTFFLTCVSLGLLFGVKVRDVRNMHQHQKGFLEILKSPPEPPRVFVEVRSFGRLWRRREGLLCAERS
jgi:hypothetical protein